MEFLYLIAGLVILLTSGEFLIRGAVSLSAHFKISKLVVGVVIVSLGTSAPELVVSIDAAVQGHPDISIGNVIGSNISNIALVLGITAAIMPIQVHRRSFRGDWSMMMFSSILLYIFILNLWLEWWEGLIFLILLSIFIFRSIQGSRKENLKNKHLLVKPNFNLWISLLLVFISSLGLIYGADFLIKGAVQIAEKLGVSERAISVSLVAFGTSVPELATSVMAAIKKETDLFIGNIVGSNIFNILAILGITSIIEHIQINPMIAGWDIFWMLGVSLLLFLFLLPLRRALLNRWNGLTFLVFYVAYIYWALLS